MFLCILLCQPQNLTDHRDVLSPDLFNHGSRRSTSRSDLLRAIATCNLRPQDLSCDYKLQVACQVATSKLRYRKLIIFHRKTRVPYWPPYFTAKSNVEIRKRQRYAVTCIMFSERRGHVHCFQ